MKIAMIAIITCLLGVLLKKEKPEYALVLVLGMGVLVFGAVLLGILELVSFFEELFDAISFENPFPIWKMLGVAYVSTFAMNICKDTGHESIASQVELFAKIMILTLSIPGIRFFMEVLEQLM